MLGAGGTIAPAIVPDLAESDEVARMMLLDLDAGAGRRPSPTRTAAARPAPDRSTRATSTSWPARSTGVDVLVNTASYRINLEAMRACLKAGCNYLDLGGLYWMTGRQLELATEFERAGLLAVLGIGSSPGKTNLMAARGVTRARRRVGSSRSRCARPAATRRRPTTAGCARRTRSRRCSTS